MRPWVMREWPAASKLYGAEPHVHSEHLWRLDLRSERSFRISMTQPGASQPKNHATPKFERDVRTRRTSDRAAARLAPTLDGGAYDAAYSMSSGRCRLFDVVRLDASAAHPDPRTDEALALDPYGHRRSDVPIADASCALRVAVRASAAVTIVRLRLAVPHRCPFGVRPPGARASTRSATSGQPSVGPARRHARGLRQNASP